MAMAHPLRILCEHMAATFPTRPFTVPDEREGTEPDRTLLATLLRATNDLVVVSHLRNGTILSVNDAFIATTGFAREQVIGRTDVEVGLWVEAPDRDTILAELRLRGSAGPVDIRFRTRSGDRRSGLFSAHIVDLDGDACVLSVLRDMAEHVHAEELLRDSEERHRLLAEHSLDIISRHAPDTTTLYVSPACTTILGYEPSDLIGRPAVEIIHPEDIVRMAQQPVTGSMRLVYRARHADGHWVWMESNAHIQTDAATGETIGITATARDMTERIHQEERLRSQTQVYEALLRAQSDLGEGFLIAEDGRVVHANDAYCRITGYSYEELAALPSLLDLASPEERALIAGRMERRARGESVPDHYETRMIRKDGSSIDLEVAHKSIDVGGASQNVTIVRDITARKRAEEALRESERRFADAYEQQREATSRLRALDSLKNEFLSAVSHELRTPLTSIMGFAQTLDANGQRLDAAEASEFVRRIIANARKLERLLADLLDLDRSTRGIIEAQRRPVDLSDVVWRAVEEWAATSPRRVRVDAPPIRIDVDAAKIERIIENLLSNAAKHTPEGTPILVTVGVGDGGAIIGVDDSGPGVRDGAKQKIFEPFYRGDDSPKHAPGTGIGLSLVKRFAEMHGGRAWVEDRPGGGAAFRVFLPGEILVSESGSDR